MRSLALIIALFAATAQAHEMVPTYPRFEPSYMEGIHRLTMHMFNKREDVEFYEVGVFDENFAPIPFVTSYRLMKIVYLGHVTFDVYVREGDVSRTRYICTKSKLRKDDSSVAIVASRICSKIKRVDE
jgi:hypothetical protein